MIETRAPGKLFIAGEYAVVEPGEPSVLVAVDRYLTVRLTEASEDSGRIHSSEYGRQPLVWVRDGENDSIVLDHAPFDFVVAAIGAVEQLRAALDLAPRYFDLHIGSELDDASGRKFGLGSSAAVTVAVIAALDEFYALGLSRAERFKLALLATVDVAPKASGGDIAASTFGGWIRYTAPDREALRLHREAFGIVDALRAPAWELCTVERLPSPQTLELLVGWTGSPASTERLVDGVRRSEQDTAQQYADFLATSRDCVDTLVAALREDEALAQPVIRRARRLLQQLGAATGIRIETDQLRALCDIAEEHGAAGKPSGAGGGDCGIVLAGPETSTGAILRAWEAHDIRRLSLTVHPPEGGTDGI